MEQQFVAWLKDQGAVISDSVGITHDLADGQDRGVIALDDIKEEELLFSIPKQAMIMVDHSKLATLLGREVMDEHLGTGWMPLILTLIWESLDSDSFWKPYLDMLPTSFSTPMFWSAEDLQDLKGCDIETRIGKDEAEAEFTKRVLPLIALRPDVFPNPEDYTLAQCHRMGSLIMAYSFNLSGAPHENAEDQDNDSDSSDSDELDHGEAGREIAMIPFADLLNSKTGQCNAKLYNGPLGSCVMKAERKIAKGEQIYNTYWPLPNGELVRRYGYLDDPNDNDTVALPVSMILDLFQDDDDRQKKVDWLEDQELVEDEYLLPPSPRSKTMFSSQLILTINVLQSPTAKKSMLRKVSDKLTAESRALLERVIKKRLSLYSTTRKEGDAGGSISSHRAMAFVIRSGEQRILQKALAELSNREPLASVSKKRKV